MTTMGEQVLHLRPMGCPKSGHPIEAQQNARGAFEITSSSTGDFDITLGFSGIPTVPDGAQFAFNGSFTQDVERL